MGEDKAELGGSTHYAVGVCELRVGVQDGLILIELQIAEQNFTIPMDASKAVEFSSALMRAALSLAEGASPERLDS